MRFLISNCWLNLGGVNLSYFFINRNIMLLQLLFCNTLWWWQRNYNLQVTATKSDVRCVDINELPWVEGWHIKFSWQEKKGCVLVKTHAYTWTIAFVTGQLSDVVVLWWLNASCINICAWFILVVIWRCSSHVLLHSPVRMCCLDTFYVNSLLAKAPILHKTSCILVKDRSKGDWILFCYWVTGIMIISIVIIINAENVPGGNHPLTGIYSIQVPLVS